MLLTKTHHLHTPSFFQAQLDHLLLHLNYLSHGSIPCHASIPCHISTPCHASMLLAGIHPEWHDKTLSDDFYEDYCEFISEFSLALKNNNLTYATKIVEQFYTRWLQSSQFPDKLNKTLDHAITAAITSLIMFHLAVQLAYVSHYSLAISYGLTLLSITVGIKITTPEWSSVGTLSGGLFKCRIFKSCTPQRSTYRHFKV